MPPAAVRTEGLHKRFGEVVALESVDIRLPAGKILGLLGPNGAGKTTAIRILTTLLRADAGRAWVAGFDVNREPRRVRAMIGLSGQHAAVDDYLSGWENLRMIARLSRLSPRQADSRAHELIETFELGTAAGRMAHTYSGGMRRRLDVAASLVASPRVLFLDEPTTGLDPRSRVGVWRLVRSMVDDGTSVLLTTQYLEEADQLADEIIVLDGGQVIAAGTPGQLKTDVGGDRLELWPVHARQLDELAEALSGLGSAPPELDRELSRVVLPVTHGPGVLVAVAQRLSAANITVQDLALRRPSLDDVFVALTQGDDIDR